MRARSSRCSAGSNSRQGPAETSIDSQGSLGRAYLMAPWSRLDRFARRRVAFGDGIIEGRLLLPVPRCMDPSPLAFGVERSNSLRRRWTRFRAMAVEAS
jgi:hypothetical protein